MKKKLYLLAHDLKLTDNVGALFRLADALGVDKLLLSGDTPKPPNRKVSKVARSTDNYVAYQYFDNPMDELRALKRDGFKLLALELTDSSQDLRNYAADADICLMLGAEVTGVPAELLELADDCAFIPMQGQNRSMNVAMAAAIAVWSLRA